MSDWTQKGNLWVHKTGEWEIERVKDGHELTRRFKYTRYEGADQRLGAHNLVGTFKSALEASQHVRNVIAKEEAKNADNN